MNNYHLDAPLHDTSTPEYFATEVCSITRAGPCSRVVFATAKIGPEQGRPMRETVVSVIIPTEMLALFAEHIKTGIPPRAQALMYLSDGEMVTKGH